MSNYGFKHAIEDEYGQDLQVDVEMGDGVVCLHWTEENPYPKAGMRLLYPSSKQTPAQARNLAKQLEAAADEAERYGG